MEARATLGGAQIATGALRLLMVALIGAFLIGGAGGYIVRALTYTVTSTSTPANATHPFVTEPVPYTTAPQSPAAEPTRDPKGFVVPI